MQDSDPKCRHFVNVWHFMAFWHFCQKANCITKTAFSAFFRLFSAFPPFSPNQTFSLFQLQCKFTQAGRQAMRSSNGAKKIDCEVKGMKNSQLPPRGISVILVCTCACTCSCFIGYARCCDVLSFRLHRAHIPPCLTHPAQVFWYHSIQSNRSSAKHGKVPL